MAETVQARIYWVAPPLDALDEVDRKLWTNSDKVEERANRAWLGANRQRLLELIGKYVVGVAEELAEEIDAGERGSMWKDPKTRFFVVWDAVEDQIEKEAPQSG